MEVMVTAMAKSPVDATACVAEGIYLKRSLADPNRQLIKRVSVR